MSLSNEQNFEKYSPSVPTTEFDWGIPYFDNTDVAVDVEASDGVITSLTLNASTNGFTVAATNGDKRLGATITTTEAYDDGDNITISRQVPYTQEYDLKNGQAINATNLNKAFDRTVAQSQQIVEQVGRQLEHPITDQDGLSYEAPAVVDRASKAAGWDASGNVVALNLASSGTIAGDGTKGIDVTNNIISAKVDGAGIDFDLNGEMVIKDGGVITDKLGNASVTTEKILDENITTATIADSNVTFPKVDFVIDDDTMATATDTNVPTSESVKAYVDSAPNFSPSSYAGEESVTLPNGLIMKFGSSAAISADSSGSVTFGTAFPAALLNVVITKNQVLLTGGTGEVTVDTLETTGFSLHNGQDNTGIFFWQAIGY